MLPGDSEATAKEKSVIFKDPRVRQFYDPDQRSGKAVAESLGYDGRVAWDIYLFYAVGGKWIQDPPVPNYWMHQISETWADRKHFHTGDDLARGLSSAAKKVANL